jgi:acetyl-CoA carboxylase carboxyl transferase subunit alpha
MDLQSQKVEGSMSNHESEAIKQAQRRRAAWAKVEMARHPARPSPTDFIKGIFTEFSEIHGDRAFGDDLAVGCGMAKLGTEQVMVIFTRRGRSLKERTKSNFGMPSPEGYRKALRCMKIAEKFGRPIICIIDLLAAYPGPSSEERGQAEAIARNLVEMSRLRVPTISAIVGQGGSGGALALAVADRVLMLDNAVYFVAPPEFAASLMWKDPDQKHLAAEALQISSSEVEAFDCVDEIVPEPPGGANTDPNQAIGLFATALTKHLAEIQSISIESLLARRRRKFRNIGQFYTEG